MIEDLFESSTSAFLVVAVFSLVLLQLCSSFLSTEKREDLPGPKALPLLGNLHQLDLKRLDIHLTRVRTFLFLLIQAMVLHFPCLCSLSSPKNTARCSECMWRIRRWLCWRDTRRSSRLWSTRLRTLERERSSQYSMTSTKGTV